MHVIRPRWVLPTFSCLLALAAMATLLGPPSARADAIINPTLFFTTFSGGSDVWKVSVSYDTTTHSGYTVGSPTSIASTPGADGIVFTSDNFLAVGGQGQVVYKVNPSNGAFTAQGTGGVDSFEMEVAPDLTIYTSGTEGGGIRASSFNSTLSAPGTPHAITGDEAGRGVTHLAWNTADSTKGFYTSAAGEGGGGFGSFGSFAIDGSGNIVTTRLIDSTPAAHSLVYDPFSGKLILFGSDTISMIDPSNPTVITSSKTFPGENFDQGAVDGQGHIFVASNTGDLVFLDISTTKDVATPDFSDDRFLASSLDDVAPLSGAGSGGPGGAVPLPAGLTLAVIGIAGLAGNRWRRGKLLA